jgi:hypothetical protein
MDVKIQNHYYKRKVFQAARKRIFEQGFDDRILYEAWEDVNYSPANFPENFENSAEFFIHVASEYWTEILETMQPNILPPGNGYEHIGIILDRFFMLYKFQPNFLIFLDLFDKWLHSNPDGFDYITTYEKAVVKAFPLLTKHLEIGKKDGSIRKDIDILEFTFTISKVITTFAQNLVLHDPILPVQSMLSPDRQLQLLKDMILHYIKN